MSSETIEDKDVESLVQSLKVFSESGIAKPIEKSVRKLLSLLRSNLADGQSADGRDYPDVKDTTKAMEIARSGPFADSRIRNEVSTNSKAMNVTGESSDSLSYEKTNVTDFNVGYDSVRSDVVFRGNAKGSGNASKPKRDPLGLNIGIPTDEEFNIVADEVEAAIERLLDGF